jgi:P27 family predicted phage terminase small subunit
MARGRKRKPAAEHKANGNPGRRNIRAEPEFPKAVGAMPPDYLNEVAKRKWHSLMPMLEKSGAITECDLTLFAAFCVHFSLWQEALKELGEQGAIHITPKGCQQVSPYDTMVRQHAALMHKLGSEFGLTPSTRSKVALVGDGAEKDEFEKVFGE